MPFFTFLLTYLITFLITELLRPKPNIEQAKPAALGDFQLPTATEGRAVPIIWGRILLKGPNVVWYGDLQADPITEKVRTGLFSKETITTGYEYRIGMQLALCRGPFGATDFLRNIRIDESFVWGSDSPNGEAAITPANPLGTTFFIDEPEFFGGEDAGGTGGIQGTGRLFPGTISQSASTYLAPFQQPTPAYRGTVYVAWEQGWIGNTPNLRPWSFEMERYPDGLDLATLQPGDEVVVLGANPMNVLFEILDNPEWGLNIGAANINLTGLRAIAAIMKAEGNGFAWIWDRELDILEVIRQVEEQVDGVLFIDPTTGQYDFKLIRFDYTPGTLPLLDETNVVQLNRFARPSWAQTSNIVKTQFADARKNYETSFALAQDMANVEIVGATNLATVNFPGVKNATLANSLAWREIRQLSRPIGQGQIVTDRSQWDLTPGDVRELSWDRLGFVRLPIRIIKVNRGDILNNKIVVDFTEDIFAVNAGSFTDPIDTGWIPVSSVALPALRERLWEVPYQLSLDNDRHLAVIASRDGGLHTSFDVYADRAGGAVFAFEGTELDWTPTALITAALDRDLNGPPHFLTDINIDGINDTRLEELNANGSVTVDPNDPVNIFLIDEEVFFYESAIDGGGGTITLQNCHRGTFDTVPADHVDDSVVWFIGIGLGLLQRVGALPQSVTTPQVKIVTRTVRNTLDIAAASALGTTVGNRVAGPIPPGSPFINTDLIIDENWTRQIGTLDFTWNTRNKFNQTFNTKQDDADLAQPGTVGARVVLRRVDTTAIVIDQANIFSDQFVVTDFIPQTLPGIPDELDFNATISNRSTALIESQTSQTVDFEVFGFGIDFGGDFGGIAPNNGIVLAQGAAPFVPDPIPGSGLDREWTIDFEGTHNASDERLLQFTVLDSLAFEFVNIDVNINGGVAGQDTLQGFAEFTAGVLTTQLTGRPFTITRVGTQVRIATRFGDVSFAYKGGGADITPGDLVPGCSLQQAAAGAVAPVRQIVSIDFYENVPDPFTPGSTIDILSPTNAPEFQNIGFDQMVFNITPLTFDARETIGFAPNVGVNNSASRTGATDQRSSTFQSFYDQLLVDPQAGLYAASGPLVLLTGLPIPMERAAIALTVEENFRVGPQFWETHSFGGPAFPPYKYIVKEHRPAIAGSLSGLPQVSQCGTSGLNTTASGFTGLIYSFTLDGTVFAETVLAPGDAGDVRDAVVALQAAIDLDARFNTTVAFDSGFSYAFFVERIATNTPFDAFADAGFGLRVEFRDISP